MGAQQFLVSVQADNMESAFQKAHGQACWDHGHSGYTGTIAEKDDYVDAGLLPDAFSAEDLERAFNLKHGDIPPALRPIIDKYADIYDDKWNHAVGVRQGNTFHFMGWASS